MEHNLEVLHERFKDVLKTHNVHPPYDFGSTATGRYRDERVCLQFEGFLLGIACAQLGVGAV